MSNLKTVMVRSGFSKGLRAVMQCDPPMLDVPLVDASTHRLSDYRVQLTCTGYDSDTATSARRSMEFTAKFYEAFRGERLAVDPDTVPVVQVVTGKLPVQVIEVNALVSDEAVIRRDRILLDASLLEHGGLLQGFDNHGDPRNEFPELVDPVWGSGLTITRVTQINAQFFVEVAADQS